ncbi:hypothetical protein, partial [Acinetobacter baumannii]|uniref:hypothetical protein n=1 Tax=Acinetobacter baumannii TaxID=470 RepID=UPI001C04B4D1
LLTYETDSFPASATVFPSTTLPICPSEGEENGCKLTEAADPQHWAQYRHICTFDEAGCPSVTNLTHAKQYLHFFRSAKQDQPYLAPDQDRSQVTIGQQQKYSAEEVPN